METANAHRIEVARHAEIPDPRGKAALCGMRSFLGLPVGDVRTLTAYKIQGSLSPDELERVRREFSDPVVECSAVGRLEGLSFDWAITVGFRPGVTDNVGRSALVAVEDTLGHRLPAGAGRANPGRGAVFTETTYLVSIEPAAGRDPLARSDFLQAARDLLANELIHLVRVESRDEWYGRPPDLSLPLVEVTSSPPTRVVDLRQSDEELVRVSREGMLSLSLAEMKAIRDHYCRPEVSAKREKRGLPSQPTDAELECLAQTWSEHCKHKIMNATIHYRDRETNREETIHSLFHSYIRRVTDELAPELGWLVSVFDDNAGVVRLNDRLNLVYKVETHNSPSALDPYGGAITGIVGVNRDPFGTGRGAELLTNVWGYCFASPFYDKPIPEGLLHPRRVRDGVHQGVIDGGNQSGIPYARGWEYFDERFLGKPLVFCGTVGLMPREVCGEPAEKKIVHPGYRVVMVGGRIGKDGIHGATFSSAELSEISPAQAVQIGDPITQKKMTDFLLEARDRGLFTSITDNGAGGLSSSVGEMAHLSGGAEIDLALAPLKYEGLAPWEILLSEAQERMTLAVPPDRCDELLGLAELREVEATVLGAFTDSGSFIVRFGDEVVALLDMEFLHRGCPTMELEAEWVPPGPDDPPRRPIADFGPVLGSMLARLNLTSIEEKARQYDHEVKGLSVVKPWVGVLADQPADATVLLAEIEGRAGVILAEGVHPRLSDLDTHIMAGWVVDLAVRRVIAAGGTLDRIAGLDNYCWPDPVQSETTPDGRYKCAQLVRASRGLYETCRDYRVPLISGKDSMKNDSTRGGVKISVPPTLLVSAIGWTEDAAGSLTLEAKAAGDLVYLLGTTREDLGASEYLAWRGEEERGRAYLGSSAPRAHPAETIPLARAVTRANEEGLLHSVHALGMGGLAVGLARVSLGGGMGLAVELAGAGGEEGSDLSDEALLFSESCGRFLVTVPPTAIDRWEELVSGLAAARIGEVTGDTRLTISRSGVTLLDEELAFLSKAWRSTLGAEDAGGDTIGPLDLHKGAPREARPPSPSGGRTVRALVLTGLGLNCERETAHAFRLAGAEVELMHLGDLLAGKSPLLDFHILALIGGFAFGDHLGAGTVLANRLRYRMGDELRRFVSEGRLLIAICNGFQTAVKLGLLPGLDGDYESRRVTVTQNDSGVFRDAWVTLKANSRSPCVFTRGLDRLEVPVRHGEGKFFAREADLLDRIEREELVALRYIHPVTGEPTQDFPHNPNGSLGAVAGLTDPTGRILGLMPHPEAHLSPLNHPHWVRRRIEGTLPASGAGVEVFRNAVDFARDELARGGASS